MEKAFEIAKRELRQCYSEKGIMAGVRHFTDYWARDCFFAGLGSLSVGDLDIVKNSIELFYSKMNSSGQIPMRIGNYNILPKIFGFKMEHRLNPRYVNDKMLVHPKDQNSLFIIMLHEYPEDLGIDAKPIMDWNLREGKLLKEGLYGSWADSVKKRGLVFYTNVLHYHALKCFADMSGDKRYMDLHKEVGDLLKKRFWNGRYFTDWIGRGRHEFFSTDGNLLAIVFDLATDEQAESIQECIDEFNINQPVPSKTNYPRYPFLKTSLIDWIGGIGDYHNEMCWLWLGCLDVMAKTKMGRKKEARRVLQRIADIIEKYGHVYEIYKDKPVERWLYKTEVPFAWSAGMFLKAYGCR